MFIAAAAVFAQESLRDEAAKYGLLVGTAAGRAQLYSKNFCAVTAKNFSSLTPENELKMDYVARKQGAYNVKNPDTIIAWAEEHGIKVRGHTLVWHKAVPGWLQRSGWSKEQVHQFLKEYITTLVGMYKGRLYAWDVVNEAFEDNGRLREHSSFFQKTCGTEYIEKAFIWAHEAEPEARLFINDYDVEMMNPKSNGLYALVEKLLAQGVPIHGVGIQAHVTEEGALSFQALLANVRRFIDLGFEVQFTELDVRIKLATEEKLAHQAQIYRDFFRIALSLDKVTAITTWGTSDRDSWIPSAFPGYATALLFDALYAPKPAYDAVLDVLKAGPEKKLNFLFPGSGGTSLMLSRAMSALDYEFIPVN
ncbi:MAG: endo-1,4-beta-xylanase [Spirochaetales bacterium]|nr:endo-1,4-beta-xylanase [Spirochaetales bacterium]